MPVCGVAVITSAVWLAIDHRNDANRPVASALDQVGDDHGSLDVSTHVRANRIIAGIRPVGREALEPQNDCEQRAFGIAGF